MESVIDPTAGITICKKTGDKVHVGDVLAVFHTSREELLSPAVKRYLEALTYSQQTPEQSKLVYAVVDKNGVRKL